MDLENQINQLDRDLMIEEANLERHQRELESLHFQIEKDKEEIDLHNKASYLLQKTAEKQREFIKDKIEKLGTAALQSIFEPQFELLYGLISNSGIHLQPISNHLILLAYYFTFPIIAYERDVIIPTHDKCGSVNSR